MSLTAGTREYELPSDALRITHVYITSGGQDYDLEPLSLDELLEKHRRQTTSNSPARYYAHAGANLLVVYPTPSAADTLTIYYVPRPTVMSTGTHDPSVTTYGGIPTEFHKAIEWYALWQGGDYDDDGSSAQGERYRALYEGQDGRGGELAKIRRAINRKIGRLAPARLKSRRPIAPHDPSTDTGW